MKTIVDYATLEKGYVEEALTNVASTIGDTYNSSTTYAVGDVFQYNGVTYTVITACTGVTPPNATYYTAGSISSLISDLSNTLDNVGSYSSNTASAVSVANETITELGTLTVSAGKYLVIGTCCWLPSSNDGYMQISFDNSSVNPARQNTVTSRSLCDGSKQSFQQATHYVLTSSSETIALYGYQSCESALSAYAYIIAIRLA